jgi:hypothetical protein
MSPRSPILIAVLGAALLAPAAARASVPPDTPVPAGQMQHTIVDTTFPPDKNSEKPAVHGIAFHNLRNERWMTATAGREIVTDTTTGELRMDCQYAFVESRCWSAPINDDEPAKGTLTIWSGDTLIRSWVDEGLGVRSLLNQGIYHITGNTTYLGRPALTIADNGPMPAPDGGTGTTSLIVDADTYFTLWSEDYFVDQPKRNEHLDQLTETKVMEVISPKGVDMTIGSHPGAKVNDERSEAAKQAARRRAAAKHKKHKKHKHHKKPVRHKHKKGY